MQPARGSSLTMAGSGTGAGATRLVLLGISLIDLARSVRHSICWVMMVLSKRGTLLCGASTVC